MALISAATLVGTSVIGFAGEVGSSLFIGTVTTTATGITSLVKYISSTDQPGMKEVTHILQEIDLEFTISVMEEVLRENQHIERESLKRALVGVHEILENIKKELEIIKESLDNHQHKYLHNWRFFNCDCNINCIKTNKIVLDKRFSVLLDLIKIYKTESVANMFNLITEN